MPSIIDYAKNQSLDHIIVNDLIEKLQYLMSIRFELFDDLRELDERIDEIVIEMREAGIEINKEEIRPR